MFGVSTAAMRQERLNEMVREEGWERRTCVRELKFGANATEEEMRDLESMMKDVLCDDRDVCRQGLVDLVAQIKTNGKSAEFVRQLVQPPHVERLVFLLGESEWADLSQRVLMRVIDQTFVPKMLECGVIEKLKALVSDQNPTVAWRCVLVIGNLVCASDLFRNEAFSSGLLESVATTESLVDREKDRLWCLRNSLHSLPFPDGLPDMVAHYVLEIATSATDCLSLALKTLEIVVKESISHEYRTEIYELKFIQRLGDALILEKTSTVIRSLTILADCCLSGDDMIEQMLFFDVPTKVRDAFMKVGVVDDMVHETLSFLENWLNSSETHINDLIHIFGFAKFFEKLLSGSSFVTKIYASRVLSRFVAVTQDPVRLKSLVSPSVTLTLTELIPIDDDHAKHYVFPILQSLLRQIDPDLSIGAARILHPFLSTPDYDSLRVSPDQELSDMAQWVESRVSSILNEIP